MSSEMILLLTDIHPICKDKFIENLSKIIHLIKARVIIRKDFVHEQKNQKGKVTRTSLKDSFYVTLEKLTDVRIQIINEIAPTLCVGQDKNKNKKVKEG